GAAAHEPLTASRALPERASRIGEEHVFERHRRDCQVEDPVPALFQDLRRETADALSGPRFELRRGLRGVSPVDGTDSDDRLAVARFDRAVRLELDVLARRKASL